MRSAHWIMMAALALTPVCGAWAVEGGGFNPGGNGLWARWQGRLSVGTTTPLLRADPMNSESSGLKISGVSLLGDYYFSRSLRHGAGGFRATSGLLLGSHAQSLLSTSASTGLSGRAFTVDSRPLADDGLASGVEAGAADSAASPYLGIGYTGLWSKTGWGFSADLGVIASRPGSAVKLGRPAAGEPSLDEVLRDLRLSPIFQVGVSYSF
ncbi:hypothetical protein [Piscinibacter sp.]|uniref:hypothetical protein n=1 Tax=Piscinibacter sp. TaxID=1903157 RepID=UPI002B558C57|nr:hypothetical protein [Albitalea sp.]HUG24590.1 hypothetical protein [Albitalea sp.]